MTDGAKPIKPITFDEFGPSLGSTRLLEVTGGSFRPKSVGQLEDELAKAFGARTDVGLLLPGLASVCKAMNDRDVARAAIASCLLSLPKISGIDDDLLEASPEDPLRPGWPKGAPDGKGGQSRSKDDADASGLSRKSARSESSV